MPKLSQQTLEKMFPCPVCGERKRTRQGLSGHIQYKHPPADKQKKQSPLDLTGDTVTSFSDFRDNALTSGFGMEMLEMEEIWKSWQQITTLFKNSNVPYNNSDYKNYLIISLTQMKANQRLYDRLLLELADVIIRMAGYK